MSYSIWNPHNSLMHYEVGTGYGARQTSYSSPYYNYEKAHAYYEAHKQLKGRTRSKSALNDEGKEVWGYVENQIKEEKVRQEDVIQEVDELDDDEKVVENKIVDENEVEDTTA